MYRMTNTISHLVRHATGNLSPKEQKRNKQNNYIKHKQLVQHQTNIKQHQLL